MAKISKHTKLVVQKLFNASVVIAGWCVRFLLVLWGGALDVSGTFAAAACAGARRRRQGRASEGPALSSTSSQRRRRAPAGLSVPPGRSEALAPQWHSPEKRRQHELAQDHREDLPQPQQETPTPEQQQLHQQEGWQRWRHFLLPGIFYTMRDQLNILDCATCHLHSSTTWWHAILDLIGCYKSKHRFCSRGFNNLDYLEEMWVFFLF
jgi:hypothetical protein